jgi:hypothetical protein
MKHLRKAALVAFAIASVGLSSLPASAADPAGPKPRCELGQITPDIAAKTPPAQLVAPKPRCRLGLIPVWEFNQWICKQPNLVPAGGANPTQ